MKRNFIGLLLAVAVTFIPAMSTQAAPLSCSAGGSYQFNGEVNYAFDGSSYYWYNAGGSVSGTGRNENNINFYLYYNVAQSGGSVRSFKAENGNLRDGQWFGVQINRVLSAALTQWFYAEAIFDKNNADDPSCYQGVVCYSNTARCNYF